MAAAYSVLALALLVTTVAADIRNTLSYSVTENTSRDQTIADLALDSGLKDEYPDEVYQLLSLAFVDEASSSEFPFKVSRGRELVTSQKVDRDSLCPSMRHCVIELDLQVQPPEYFQIIKVKVTINDTNDNAPSFSPTVIDRVVSETSAPGHKIPIPLAIDADSPQYGIQGYNLVDPSGKFELKVTNTSTEIQDIYLSLREKLDREAVESYEVQVMARDSGNKTGVMRVNIQVQDVNDNPPIFTNQTYEFRVVENVNSGTEVGRIIAHDADAGANGVVKYGISSTSDANVQILFVINSTSGVITVTGELDREVKDTYTLSITGENDDPNSLPTVGKAVVHILDLNDNAPRARIRGSEDDQTVTIAETAAPGSFVAHISVIDPDVGKNGTFSCSINSAYFQLERMFDTEFKLSTKRALDREVRSEHTIDFRCSDNGDPVQRSTKKVVVTIGDVNDNAPRFLQSVYSTSTLENNAVGVFLVQVRAVDSDEGLNGQVRYRFTEESNSTILLRLDAQSGNITANASFDHESIANHRIEVQVEAYDQGAESNMASVSVIIDIIDVDDEIPRFTQKEYNLGVYENEQIQTEVGVVEAIDRDSDIFNRFQYHIDYDNDDADSFTVNAETGEIFTSEVLDRERQAEYQFTVRAVSSGLHPKSSTAIVSVYVADRNDNAPAITFPNFKNNTVHISNKTPQQGIVTTVIAEDVDANFNARISFSIVSGNSQEYFAIDEYTGVLVLQKEVSKFDHKLFGLVISVRDHGEPPRASEAFLNVIVNKSISDSDSGLLTNQNLTIVIAIATVSGLLMVMLLISIAAILRWPKLLSCVARSKNQKYNQNARMIDRKTAINESFTAASQSGSECGSVNMVSVDPAVTAVTTAVDHSFVNLSFQDETKDSQHLQIRAMEQSRLQHNAKEPGYKHDQSLAPSRGEGQRQRVPGQSLPPRDYPQAPTTANNSSHLYSFKKAAVVPPTAAAVPPHSSDTDSACSADLSNVTDSGRGSHGSSEEHFPDSAALGAASPGRTLVSVGGHEKQTRQGIPPKPVPPPAYNHLPTKHTHTHSHWKSPLPPPAASQSARTDGYHGNTRHNGKSRTGVKLGGAGAISHEVHV